MKKLSIAIIFGGKSAEHEVSVQSALNVAKAINKKKYKVSLIGIDKDGQWHLNVDYSLPGTKETLLSPTGKIVTFTPNKTSGNLISASHNENLGRIDVVFPMLHGTYGEDGTIQGLIKIYNLPYVGAGVAASAIGMDKDIFKRLLRDAGIPVAKFLCFKKPNQSLISFNKIKKHLGLPLFVKPANLGSSIGIHKVHSEKEFKKAIEEAFTFDTKILIEEFIKGREIECSVLGNENPIASLPGEVIPTHEFYSYQAKYLDENGAVLEIPANVPQAIIEKIQSLALKTFETIGAEGMARVDFFLKSNGEAIVNEINTIPGFTNISMYPKLWDATGISYEELIDKLIQLAIKRYERDKKLKTSVDPQNLID